MRINLRAYSYCNIRYFHLNTFFSAIIPIHEFKLLEVVNYCFLGAQ